MRVVSSNNNINMYNLVLLFPIVEVISFGYHHVITNPISSSLSSSFKHHRVLTQSSLLDTCLVAQQEYESLFVTTDMGTMTARTTPSIDCTCIVDEADVIIGDFELRCTNPCEFCSTDSLYCGIFSTRLFYDSLGTLLESRQSFEYTSGRDDDDVVELQIVHCDDPLSCGDCKVFVNSQECNDCVMTQCPGSDISFAPEYSCPDIEPTAADDLCTPPLYSPATTIFWPFSLDSFSIDSCTIPDPPPTPAPTPLANTDPRCHLKARQDQCADLIENYPPLVQEDCDCYNYCGTELGSCCPFNTPCSVSCTNGGTIYSGCVLSPPSTGIDACIAAKDDFLARDPDAICACLEINNVGAYYLRCSDDCQYCNADNTTCAIITYTTAFDSDGSVVSKITEHEYIKGRDDIVRIEELSCSTYGGVETCEDCNIFVNNDQCDSCAYTPCSGGNNEKIDFSCATVEPTIAANLCRDDVTIAQDSVFAFLDANNYNTCLEREVPEPGICHLRSRQENCENLVNINAETLPIHGCDCYNFCGSDYGNCCPFNTPCSVSCSNGGVITSGCTVEADKETPPPPLCSVEIPNGGGTETFIQGESYGSLVPSPCGDTDLYPCYCDTFAPGRVRCPYCVIQTDATDPICLNEGETGSYMNEFDEEIPCECAILGVVEIEGTCEAIPPTQSPVSPAEPTAAPTTMDTPTAEPSLMPLTSTPSVLPPSEGNEPSPSGAGQRAVMFGCAATTMITIAMTFLKSL